MLCPKCFKEMYITNSKPEWVCDSCKIVVPLAHENTVEELR